MTDQREQQIESYLQQSKRMLRRMIYPRTTERIGKMIAELERELQLDREK
jgi:hypothetical protein